MAINQIRQIGLEKDSMALISAGSQQNLATRDDITPKVKAQLLPKNENGLGKQGGMTIFDSPHDDFMLSCTTNVNKSN